MMTLDQFNAATSTLMDSVAAMTVATCISGQPWAADVYFAADGYEFFFLSSPTARHSENLQANPLCAVTIHAPATSWKDIKGLQLEGIAEPVKGMEATAHAFHIYGAKFPFAQDLMSDPVGMVKKTLNVKAHVFRPERIRYIDNTLGFGTRLTVRLEDGRALGNPESE